MQYPDEISKTSGQNILFISPVVMKQLCRGFVISSFSNRAKRVVFPLHFMLNRAPKNGLSGSMDFTAPLSLR